ncbi:hypothetical protein [Jongsikchunia kroppenstedtii]|uniref:hypothetical protein n=1 Tax=Jongsikchunia kroppenstedtii TaxID=1121721 RepID=UPI00037FD71C|nr:hypothetical protein [Jongsikchunia kroppenstedtii]
MKVTIPRTVFGGRMRSTTLLLIVVFIGLMLAYGQASAHYQKQDEAKAREAAAERFAQRPRPTETEPTTEPTTTTRRKPTTSSSSSTPTTSSSASTAPTSMPDESGTSSSPAPPGPFQLPPGFSLPSVPRIP